MKCFLVDTTEHNSELYSQTLKQGTHVALHEADVEVASDACQPLTGLSVGPASL